MVFIRELKSAGGGWRIPAFLFLGLLLLNACLVSPFIGWYDSGEMVGATACLGISHPSGQVLFHLMGKIFLFLPWGTPAWRLGLMSAVCSALASVLFWVLSCRLAGQTGGLGKTPSTRFKLWLALLTLAWSLSQPWWVYSLTPLVYTLHLLLALLVLWALSLDRPGKWVLAFFILGMATVFRPTQFFALPFVGAAFLWDLWKGRKPVPKTLLLSIVGFGLGRSTLLYLPLRSALHPDIAFGDLTHPMALVRHVLALKFSNSVGANSFSNVLHVAGMMAGRFWTDLTPFGIGLLFWGLGLLYWKKEKIPAFLWVALGWGFLEGAFVFTIPFPTFEPHQVLLGWVFGGLVAGLPLAVVGQIFRKSRSRSAVMEILLAAFVLAQLFSIGHLWERKKERGAEDYARNLLTIMAPNALYVPTEENEYFPVVGYQQSFSFRKDVQVLEPGSDPSIIAPRIQTALQQGRPLYVTRKWDLPPGWVYRWVGPLLQITAPSPVEPEAATPPWKPGAEWGNVVLERADVSPGVVRQGGIMQIDYLWAHSKSGGPLEKAAEGTSVVVALFIDSKGDYWMKNGVFWLQDIHDPIGGSFSGLKPGFMYREKRILFIPSDFPPGNYALVVGLQKQEPVGKGQESFGREFYERNASQNLDKFMGRGENGALVQFSSEGGEAWKGSLWPVTKSLYPIADPRFVPVAEVEIQPSN